VVAGDGPPPRIAGNRKQGVAGVARYAAGPVRMYDVARRTSGLKKAGENLCRNGIGAQVKFSLRNDPDHDFPWRHPPPRPQLRRAGILRKNRLRFMMLVSFRPLLE
jgi:hypothetical protein